MPDCYTCHVGSKPPPPSGFCQSAEGFGVSDPTRDQAYLRTSSAANMGADKDREKRQRAAIEAFPGLRADRQLLYEAVSRADQGSCNLSVIMEPEVAEDIGPIPACGCPKGWSPWSALNGAPFLSTGLKPPVA